MPDRCPPQAVLPSPSSHGAVDVTAVPSSHGIACANVVQDVTKGRIDRTAYRLVGRMQSPNMYCRTRDTFPLDVPRV